MRTTYSSVPFCFGIYPGGMAGGDQGLLTGPPDDFVQITAARRDLQGRTRRLIVRCYDNFQDRDSKYRHASSAPRDFVRFANESTPLDLVLQYRSASGDIEGYLQFVADRLQRYAQVLHSVQITEEPNFADGPDVIDGPYPDVLRAVIEGVVASKQLLRRLGKHEVKVGFNVTPTFGPGASFWTRLASGGSRFIECLDYVGLDCFPDVFRPVAADGEPGDLASSVVGILETMRSVWLPEAGVPAHIPIHICEHGWPTSEGRSEARQATALECVIRTVHSARVLLNISSYSLFALRDVATRDSANARDLFSFFGIMTAAYERKIAFDTYQRLIWELGG